MAIGPVQMLVLGFAEPNFTGKIAAELDRLRELEFIKIVDALVVNKDENGDITALQVSDLSDDEATEMGAIAGALIGFGYGGGEDDDAIEAGAERCRGDGGRPPDPRRRGLVRGGRDPERHRGGDHPDRAHVGDPAAELDRRGRGRRARGGVDPPEGPDRGRRQLPPRSSSSTSRGVAAGSAATPGACSPAPSDCARHDRIGSPSPPLTRHPRAMPNPAELLRSRAT